MPLPLVVDVDLDTLAIEKARCFFRYPHGGYGRMADMGVWCGVTVLLLILCRVQYDASVRSSTRGHNRCAIWMAKTEEVTIVLMLAFLTAAFSVRSSLSRYRNTNGLIHQMTALVQSCQLVVGLLYQGWKDVADEEHNISRVHGSPSECHVGPQVRSLPLFDITNDNIASRIFSPPERRCTVPVGYRRYFMSAMVRSRTLRLASLALANALLPVAVLVFASGFFPYKPLLSGLATFEDDQGNGDWAGDRPRPVFDRVVFMVVDALRSDFVYGHNSGFHFTQRYEREKIHGKNTRY